MKNVATINSLINLGLSPHEAECYLVLAQNGALSVSGIAKQMDILPNAAYRLLDKLEAYHMIVPLGRSPKKYQAIPVQAAVDSLVQTQTKSLEKSKAQTLSTLFSHGLAPTTKIDFITGQDSFFKTFVELSKGAKQEILVISIGEPVSDDIKLATRDALAKGVECKFIFHIHNEQNDMLLKSWVAMGVEVAHYPDAGFHLLVFDGQKAVLVASNPEETAERTGMVITSPSLANALRDFFYARWDKATLIRN